MDRLMPGLRSWCRWCRGGGCVACPPPPEPRADPESGLLLAVDADPTNDPEGWRVLREALGKEAVDRAFAPGGGGVDELRRSIAVLRLVAALERVPGAEEG